MSANNKVGRVGSLSERLLRYSKVQPSGCWEWQRHLHPTGYATTSLKRVQIKAHRAAYEVFVGKIPDGLELDHLCGNRKCINPDHLEPVTRRENIFRSNGPSALNARKTHCLRGHEFPTVYQPGRIRRCRTCERNWKQSKAATI